jgi:hypothetical protein
MRRDSAITKALIFGLILAFMAIGCRAVVKPTEEPAGIGYRVAKEANLTRVSLYQKNGYWWVDVGLKNVSGQKQVFRVSVEVDDWPAISVISGGKKRLPLEAQKEETIKVMTLAKSLPKKLAIQITPYQ